MLAGPDRPSSDAWLRDGLPLRCWRLTAILRRCAGAGPLRALTGPRADRAQGRLALTLALPALRGRVGAPSTTLCCCVGGLRAAASRALYLIYRPLVRRAGPSSSTAIPACPSYMRDDFARPQHHPRRAGADCRARRGAAFGEVRWRALAWAEFDSHRDGQLAGYIYFDGCPEPRQSAAMSPTASSGEGQHRISAGAY